MKFNTAPRSISSSGMNVHVDFTIDMNGKAFNVLSDGMYSDVISTIVRELSSNAYDAHVAAGTPDKPFEVYCPSAFDPHFAVKDYGTGLRYFSYTANITNEHVGESTIFIRGDIRNVINGITLVVLNNDTTVRIGAILYDNSADRTVIRVSGDYEGTDVQVEFDDALVLYSTYFRSTKEQSNDYIGAFGLGSKTPFAYTDNFIVINRFNGVQRVYNILTNSESKPQINLMMSSVTDEPNGLEVKLAVSPHDYTEFKTAIRDQLMYFDPLPIVCNEEVTFPTVVHRGKTFILMSGDMPALNGSYYNRNAYACVGNNSYQIKNIESDLFKTENVVLKFAVGEVMVTASREELKYDSLTETNIRNREKEAIAEYTKYVLDTVKNSTMKDYEKADFLNSNYSVIDLSAEIVRKHVGNPHYRYNPKSITLPLNTFGAYTNIVYSTIEGVTNVSKYQCRETFIMDVFQYDMFKTKSTRINGERFIQPMDNITIFVRDNSYCFRKKIELYLSENDMSDNKNIYIVEINKRNNESEVLAAMEEIIGHTAKFIRLSSIDLPKGVKTSTRSVRMSTTPVSRVCKLGTNEFGYTHHWEEDFTPLTKIDRTAYIVSSERNVIDLRGTDQVFLNEFFSAGFSFDPTIRIIALPRLKYSKAITYGFRPVSELITKLKSEITVPLKLINREALIETYNLIDSCVILDIFGYFGKDDLKMLHPSNPVRKLLRIKNVIGKRYMGETGTNEFPYELISHIPDSEKPAPSKIVTKGIYKVKRMCDNINKSLILIQDLRSWNFNESKKKKVLCEYLNMIYPDTDTNTDTDTGETNE